MLTAFSSTYRGLSSRTRVGLGVGLLAWSAVGLYLSDRAEEAFGFKPSEEDSAALNRMTPTISVVDKEIKGR
jgi:hypothetical protein